MMKKVLISLVLAALAGLVFAAASDTQYTADGGMSLDGYTSLEAVAYDGDATLTLIKSSTSTVVKTYYLRDSLPRSFSWYTPGDGIDSCYVDIDTASEVIVTPK